MHKKNIKKNKPIGRSKPIDNMRFIPLENKPKESWYEPINPFLKGIS